MGMKVLFSVEVTNKDKWDLIERGLLEAVNKGLARSAGGVTRDMRAAVRKAKFTPGGIPGQRFEKSFRVDIWPSRSNVLARAPAMTVGTSARFAEVFEEGVTISPRDRQYLAIALPAARQLGLQVSGTSKRKKSNVKAAQDNYGPLRRIPTRRGYVLAADAKKLPQAAQKGRYVPLFAMVKQVTLQKRYSIRAIVQRHQAKIGDRVNAEMRRIFGE